MDLSYLIRKPLANLFLSMLLLGGIGPYANADTPDTPLEAQEVSLTTTGAVIPQPVKTQTAPDPVKEAIKAQLKAFQDRDQKAVWDTASPALQEKYDTQKNFYRMVRFDYRSLYNHESVTFLSQSITDDTAIQKVSFKRKKKEEPTLFIYRLKKQDNGTWKIEDFLRLDTKGERAS